MVFSTGFGAVLVAGFTAGFLGVTEAVADAAVPASGAADEDADSTTGGGGITAAGSADLTSDGLTSDALTSDEEIPADCSGCLAEFSCNARSFSLLTSTKRCMVFT